MSKKIVLARKKQGLTQEELASLAHVTVRTIQRIESGESVPRAFTIKALARALETNFEELANEMGPEGLGNQPDLSPIGNDPGNEKHFLQTLCLSCFSYLVIPFVHFLIPVYLLRKQAHSHPETVAMARAIIRQQIYWIIVLHALMLLTLGYNLIMAAYFNKAYLISYLVPFFAMYLANAFMIIATFRRVDQLKWVTVSN
ncbi:helix-turn-helix domain-containing protein [Niabella yanshanensis]|uniref:Helix-turn-helix domain-containing protein n=1 Tax=Niabella yanshanensis TaxID=577386 RepID=A0ABZ0WD57_9BACT|nr:helix-turn-helix domain-containing protein [Niabella yanshanensis]WQD40487.1 helix-turn-helix domain-containing protein [Niabella yanshanensis]